MLDLLKKVVVYDNEGETFDRYTVYTPDGAVYGMSSNGLGFNMYLGEFYEVPQGEHLGKKLRHVPLEIRHAVLCRIEMALN